MDHREVMEQILRVSWKRMPPLPSMGVRFFTFSRTPDQMRGMHRILAIRPEVPAYMKLSRKRLVFWSQNSAVSLARRGRSLDL